VAGIDINLDRHHGWVRSAQSQEPFGADTRSLGRRRLWAVGVTAYRSTLARPPWMLLREENNRSVSHSRRGGGGGGDGRD
jgi:hypothetical protein